MQGSPSDQLFSCLHGLAPPEDRQLLAGRLIAGFRFRYVKITQRSTNNHLKMMQTYVQEPSFKECWITEIELFFDFEQKSSLAVQSGKRQRVEPHALPLSPKLPKLRETPME